MLTALRGRDERPFAFRYGLSENWFRDGTVDGIVPYLPKLALTAVAYVYGGGHNVGYSLASRMRVVAIAHDIVGGSWRVR